MRMPILALSILLATAPAQAQTLEPLREALSNVPQSVFASRSPEQVLFIDIAALHRLSETEAGLSPGIIQRRGMVGGLLRPVEALTMAPAKEWGESAGVDIADVRYFAGFGRSPNMSTVWGLKDNAAATGLLGALAKRDFRPSGVPGVFGNGEPLKRDLAKNKPSDPWRGRVGTPTFGTAKGNVVMQASTPQETAMLLAEFPGVDESAVVAAAMAGLQEAVGDAEVVQAMLVSPLLGLSTSIDPAVLMPSGSKDPEAMREKLKAGIEAGRKGIPPYLGGFIADAQGGRPAVAIALTYLDCETADKAAALVAQRWAETMPAAAQGETSTKTVAAVEGLCAAMFRVDSEAADDGANAAFHALFQAYLRRQFTVLQIGEAD